MTVGELHRQLTKIVNEKKSDYIIEIGLVEEYGIYMSDLAENIEIDDVGKCITIVGDRTEEIEQDWR